jgi:hypothetical protein
MADTLVVSNITSHTALDLCSSDTSWGPDFVGPDGLFCDMETKRLMPLCSTNDVNGCIDIDGEANTAVKRSTVKKRQINSMFRSYKTINNW